MHRQLFLLGAVVAAAQAAVLFQDRFDAQGTRLNTAAWTTETGPSSFLGRTQLADWISPGGIGQFVVGPGGAQLALHTYNPTGFSLYGTHGKTLLSFQPEAASAIVFTTRLQLTSLQPGVVYGIYLYGCPSAGCAVQHDEIDIELVTNLLQPGAPLRVQLNRYAAEPLGAGNGSLVELPAGFDPLAPHNWTIRWSLARIDYLVDGVLLSSAATHVPQGPMQVNEIAWGPAEDWLTAFSASLQPVANAAMDQSFVALLNSVTVLSVAQAPVECGVFRSGFLWLLDKDGNRQFNTPPDLAFSFGGVPGDIPITGDWNGSGASKAGVYRSSNGLFILDYDGDGQLTSADRVFSLGVGAQPDDIPVAGDWNGDGRSKVGIFRQRFFWILDTNGDGTFGSGDDAFAFGGVPGDVPVVGDWNGSGTSKIGVFRAGFLWVLDSNGNHTVDAGDEVFPFGGISGDIPVVGDWSGAGTSKVGVFRAGFFWILDNNGNHAFDPGTDQAFAFGGIAGDKPVVGKW